jgi:hypothetical protein
MWKIVENCVEVVKNEPKAIVRVLRIICKLPNYEDEIRQHLDYGVQQRLHEMYGQTEDLEELTDITLRILQDIQVIKTQVIPCFPPIEGLEGFFIAKYRQKIEEKILPWVNDLDSIR